jgi:uncharacterized protein YdhG (YjbR/CyaY superfamily)
MAGKQTFETMDAYIAACPAGVRPILEEIRQTIRQAAPGAVETISYQIPTFKLEGKSLVHFAAWKDHIGFYATPSGNDAFQKELSKFKLAKGSVQFPLAKPMPLGLIRKIVQFRVKEIRP